MKLPRPMPCTAATASWLSFLSCSSQLMRLVPGLLAMLLLLCQSARLNPAHGGLLKLDYLRRRLVQRATRPARPALAAHVRAGVLLRAQVAVHEQKRGAGMVRRARVRALVGKHGAR